MVRHIIFWKQKDGFSEEEKQNNASEVKRRLEALENEIEGIISIRVITNLLPNSDADLVLDSVFEDRSALDAYQVHPAHQKAAGFVRSVVKERHCVDFSE